MRNQRPLLSVCIVLAWVLMCLGAAHAEPSTGDSAINVWLMRAHEASRQRAYTGTFVVSAGARTATAKIWHVCDGIQQMERIEPLSGPPRSTFRRNDQVITFFPESKTALTETRDSLGLFPNLLKSNSTQIGDFYQIKILGLERVAGVDADVVLLAPIDSLRYGYRVWSERKTGLVVQLQTLNGDGRVLEQAAFSELQLDAPVSMAKLTHMMQATDGYRIEHQELQKTTPDAQGWVMGKDLAGFKPVGCYLRPITAGQNASTGAGATLQWIFSDGLATVSLFIEPMGSRKNGREVALDFGGSTRTLTRQVDRWRVTAIGEVPAATLGLLIQGLMRKK
jgi:sigma-E factor negative regulatory protein RseB